MQCLQSLIVQSSIFSWVEIKDFKKLYYLKFEKTSEADGQRLYLIGPQGERREDREEH